MWGEPSLADKAGGGEEARPGMTRAHLLARVDDCSCPAQTSSRNQPPFYFLGGSFFFFFFRLLTEKKNFKKQKTQKRKKILVHEIKIFFIAWSSLQWISFIALSTPSIPFQTTAKSEILRDEGWEA